MVSVIDDRSGSATPSEMAAIDAFNERLQARGHLVLAGGLASPGASTVIDNRGGAAVVAAGPLLASREYLSGLWIIDAPDQDAALALAAEGSRACNRRVEVRPFLGG
jgi:hypothetical protein